MQQAQNNRNLKKARHRFTPGAQWRVIAKPVSGIQFIGTVERGGVTSALGVDASNRLVAFNGRRRAQFSPRATVRAIRQYATDRTAPRSGQWFQFADAVNLEPP